MKRQSNKPSCPDRNKSASDRTTALPVALHYALITYLLAAPSADS